jgi:tetratricopeptide (TPR) repeat protein
MYFARKLSLNPALAEAGKAVDRIQISAKVSVIATRITEKLPQSLLLGREYIEDELKPGEFEGIHKELSTDDVNQFLKACEEDIQGGVRIEPGNVAMAAQIHYYRVYFEKEGTEARDAQERKALDWINRALMFDPLNPDFQMKLADVYNAQGRYVEAVSMIERLERDDNAPQYIQQWLGYFLLFIDGREQDAIGHSLEFHKRFPDESSGLFNASCGYAQLYTIELRQQGVKELLSSNNRTESLRLLQLALQADSDQKILARKQAEPGQSFESLAADPEFTKLIASTSESKAN